MLYSLPLCPIHPIPCEVGKPNLISPRLVLPHLQLVESWLSRSELSGGRTDTPCHFLKQVPPVPLCHRVMGSTDQLRGMLQAQEEAFVVFLLSPTSICLRQDLFVAQAALELLIFRVYLLGAGIVGMYSHV